MLYRDPDGKQFDQISILEIFWNLSNKNGNESVSKDIQLLENIERESKSKKKNSYVKKYNQEEIQLWVQSQEDDSLSAKLKVILEPSEEGGYTVYVPALPGCISEGDTREDALAKIYEAIDLYLEPPKEEDLPPGAEALELTL